MPASRLGPIHGATLVCDDLQRVSEGYQSVLGFKVVQTGKVSQELAEFWQTPNLYNAPMLVMAADNGDAWLRVIEDKNAPANPPLKTYGWMSLEFNVNKVDDIATSINTQYFDVIGEPAYLQVSDAIKAMQVIGPANEVSYITQIDKPVPPFELPMTEFRTGSLFIPVLCTPDRQASLSFYQDLHQGQDGLMFDTKVTVLNNAWGLDIEHQFPVATLQLNGQCLFEIDQVEQANAAAGNKGSLPSGIAMITCVCNDLDAIASKHKAKIHPIDEDYYSSSTRAILLRGPAGELIEIVEPWFI